MTEPTRLSASETMDAATKDRALLAWLKIAATHSLPPTDFGSLQIAHAAAHTESKEELPTWAWAEYQVIHDNHATTTKAPRSFRKLPTIFESAQWRNARKLKTIERSLFPTSGPLGELLNLTPTPAPNPTMPDPSPLEELAENIPIGSPETNEEMKEGEDDTPVQYLAWLIRDTITPLTIRLEQADANIPDLRAVVEKQTRAINTLTTALQDLRKEAKKPTPTPTPTPTNPPKGKGKAETTISNPPTTTKKSYANVASSSNTPPPADFTKVTHQKKKTKAPFFTPEYTKLNRQVIVETNGQIPELISNHDILEVVNEATMAQGLRFLSAQRSTNGNLPFETNPATSADEGAKYHVQITFALEKLHIQATNIYANSRWSKFVIHGVPAHIGTRNTPELSSRIAEEIFQATNFSMAQPPRWLTSPAILENRGSGTIIVSFPGKVENLDQTIEMLSVTNAWSTDITKNPAPNPISAQSARKTTPLQPTSAKPKDAPEA
ncbi:hypothetical protein Q9L58_010197 [Maublancomyces gigas]|uniref:Gag protein n=1 Tax=Discina gigas TaxID=1032678 RepID=A0ABR3G4T6_9PEZI